MASICTVFKWLGCLLFKWHSKTRPFGIQPLFDHLNNKLVRYSYPHSSSRHSKSVFVQISDPYLCNVKTTWRGIVQNFDDVFVQFRRFWFATSHRAAIKCNADRRVIIPVGILPSNNISGAFEGFHGCHLVGEFDQPSALSLRRRNKTVLQVGFVIKTGTTGLQ